MSTGEAPRFAFSANLNAARRSSPNRDHFAHQRVALDRLQAWYKSPPGTTRGGILVLPTGGGKTFTAVSFLCAAPLADGLKVLWLAHTHHLLEQAYETFQANCGRIPAPRSDLTVRVVSGTHGHYPVSSIECGDDVVVATLQTITGAYKAGHRSLVDFLGSSGGRLCVVFDEAHHAPAPSYRGLLRGLRTAHPDMLLLGLTATPTHSDAKKVGWLKELFPQGIIHQTTANELLAAEILSKPIFEKVPTDFEPEFDQAEYERWVDSFRDIPEDIIQSLAKNDDRNQRIAGRYLANRDRYGKTIIFASSWPQCERIASLLKEGGVRAGSVYSHVDASPATPEARNSRRSTENAEVMRRFKSDELDVILNVRMLTEGTDVPATRTVFLTRQTTSPILLTQMVGRALRGPKTGGTKEAYIVSFEDSWKQKINWAEYEQLRDGPTFDDDPTAYARRPMALVSIDLVRRLVEQMDSSVNVAPAPFLSLMPVGWYRVELQVLVEGSDDVEPIRPLVLVFDHQKQAYHQFIEALSVSNLDLSDFKGESVSLSDPGLADALDGWAERFFPATEDELKSVDKRDLLLIARHVAQNEGDRPEWFDFDQRESHDLDAVAAAHFKADFGPARIWEDLKNQYEDRRRYWRTLYPSFAHFKTQYDACSNRLNRSLSNGETVTSAPTVTPLAPPPDREPSSETKLAIFARDHHRCLCCGETVRKRLEADHIRSRYHGGDNAPDNLQTLCRECNGRKGSRTINFRSHRPEGMAPTDPPVLSIPTNDVELVGAAELWERELRRTINMFYGCAAVASVEIGKKGVGFHNWTVRLFGGNDSDRIAPYMRSLVLRVRQLRGESGYRGPSGIRVVDERDGETAYFDLTPSPSFGDVPEGTRCRLRVGVHVHEGAINDDSLKVGHRSPFKSLTEASRELGGRPGAAWKDWEFRPPGASAWKPADEVRARFKR